MQEKSFPSFTLAAAYAKQLAQETGTAVKVEKNVGAWIVISSSTGALDKEKQHDLDKIRARQTYLEMQEYYYRKLPLDELETIWKNRKENRLQPDETGLLREIVRSAKGIEPVSGTRVVACRQCGMVGDNCTCGRTWF